MAVAAITAPRKEERTAWLGRLCLRYMNWVSAHASTRFIHMTTTPDEGDPGPAPEGLYLKSFSEIGDIAYLLRVFNRAYVGAPDYRKAGWIQGAALQACSTYDPSLIWIAYKGDEPVGFCMSRHNSRGGRITGLGVLPEWRRRGIGTYILRYAMAQLTLRGCTKIALSAAAGNTEGRRIYHRLGFRDM